jgi:2-desacetyl-2-hydroxyethyl bacteriochlorophyllide A dehydrogenase
MKALRYLNPDILETQNIRPPVCGKGEALIRVHSAGICGTDLAIAAGKHPRAKAPLVMGHEFAGQVKEIQPGHTPTDLTVGDKATAYPLLVCGQCWACTNGCEHVCRNLKLIGIDRDGAFAEYVSVPLDLVMKLPDNLTYDQGALIEPLAVGIHAVAMADVVACRSAVVIGAGPIGLLVALCLKKAGVSDIIMTESDVHRRMRAENLGFDVFDSEERGVADEVNRVTGNEGADMVFECAGTLSAARQMCKLVRTRGRVVVVGVHKEPHPVDLQTLNFREISMIGTRVYTREDFQKALQVIRDLPVEELISHKIPIDKAPQGFELIKKTDDVCKVIIQME